MLPAIKEPLMSLVTLLLDHAPTAPTPSARLARLAALWWWSLKLHVAELHGLPRGSAGPRP
jgi:hypothetical protein